MFSLEYNPDRALTTRDAALGELFEEIRAVIAPSGLNVLVVGASGVGKEGIASAIHFHSDRKDKPFIAVNCAAISESLAESEFFGHEKGAFTGAIQARPGYFESAQGGTIFLDEIGELPLAMQAKLLRVLEVGEIVRVGSSSPRKVDVRVVAATNRDPRSMVAEGKFREDLYYRLAADSIRLPALSERPGDVVFLAEQFIREEAAKRGLRMISLSTEVAEVLRSYTWPGNVRELKWLVCSAVARHAVRRSQHPALLIDDLPRHFSAAEAAPATETEAPRAITPATPETSPTSQNIAPRPYQYRDMYGLILYILSTEKSATIPDLARRIGRSKDAIRRSIARLERDGKLRVIRQPGPNGVEVQALT